MAVIPYTFLPKFMLRSFRLVTLLALPVALAACNTGTKAGDTNVELSAPKKMMANKPQGQVNGDSLAAGIQRDTAKRPSGKQIYQNANKAVDRNHDGIAD